MNSKPRLPVEPPITMILMDSSKLADIGFGIICLMILVLILTAMLIISMR